MARIGRGFPRQPLLRPPQVVLPLPTLQMQTITTHCVSVQAGSTANRRRYAARSVLGQPQVVVPFVLAQPAVQAWGYLTVIRPTRRKLGAWRIRPPPLVLAPLAPAITTTLAALKTRASVLRRGTHPLWVTPKTGPPWRPIQVFLATRTRPELRARPAKSRLSPPPVVLSPLATLRQQTITVTLAGDARRQAQRRQGHSALSRPTTVLPLQLPTAGKVTVRLARLPAPRTARSRLSPPTVVLPLPTSGQQTIRTVLAGGTRATSQRHDPHSKLSPPATVKTAVTAEGPEPTITVVRPPRRRVGTWQLGPPVAQTTTAPPVAPVTVTLAERTRLEQVRHQPRSFLSPPVVVTAAAQPATGFPPQAKLTVYRPRRRRVGTWQLPPPVFVTAMLAPPVQSGLSIKFRRNVEGPRRAAHSHLSPPVTADQPVAAIQVHLASRRRAGRWQLKPPTVVAYYPPFIPPPAVPPPAPLVTKLLQAQGQRNTRRLNDWRYWVLHYVSGPAEVAPPAAPTQQQQTILVTLAGRARRDQPRRTAKSRLTGPLVIGALPTRQQQTITVRLAGRNRLEQSRRSSHQRLSGPLVIGALPTQQEETLTVWFAGRNRQELRRRGTHWLLRPPTVVRPLPTLQQELIVVSEVALRTRSEHLRRTSLHSRLSPPAVVTHPFVTSARLRMLRGLGL